MRTRAIAVLVALVAAPVRAADFDAICAGIHNSQECAQAIEDRQIKRFPAVKRVGRQLIIDVAGGKQVVLSDQDGEGQGEAYYNFRDRFGNYYLIHEQYWEGDAYLLIHISTGKQIRIQGVPVLSPDRQRFVTASFDLEAGYNPNTVQIWRIKGDTALLEWSLSPETWGPSNPGWIDDQNIQLMKNELADAAAAGYRQTPIRLRLESSGWRLHEQ